MIQGSIYTYIYIYTYTYTYTYTYRVVGGDDSEPQTNEP